MRSSIVDSREGVRVDLEGHSYGMWERQNVPSVRNEGIHFGNWMWLGIGRRVDTTDTAEKQSSDSNCWTTLRNRSDCNKECTEVGSVTLQIGRKGFATRIDLTASGRY